MKFAFSTVACPAWNFETLAARAREYGYDGVEILGFLDESTLTASNPFLTDPTKLRSLFAESGVEIACLAGSLSVCGSRRADQKSASQLRAFIDTAQAIDCPLVKISDTQVRTGRERAATAVEMARWLMPLGDYAADHDTSIVVENLQSFRTARGMWAMLEICNQPSIACCWDVFNAALVGESPFQSVPVLNSRIQYAQVRDAKLSATGAMYCKVGEGDVAVEKFLTRLRGIGYGGYVTLEWEKAWLANLAEPEAILADGLKKLREWTQPQPPGPGDSTPASMLKRADGAGVANSAAASTAVRAAR